MISDHTMSTLSFVIFPIFTLIYFIRRSEQVSPTPIVDSKTGQKLPVLTHIYYAIQNQKTLRFLIWFGNNGTVDSQLEETQGKYWHIFEKLNGTWYKMSHHFGSHIVKIAKSHEEGYYHIYNKDCFNGEHPNADGDARGIIKCLVVEKGNMLEFNWRFLKKHKQKEVISKKNEFHIRFVFILIPIVVILCGVIALTQHIRKTFNSVQPIQVIYSQDNQGFIDTPVFPAHCTGKI